MPTERTTEDDVGLSDRYVRSSPWPVFVALGLVAAEVGVFLDFFPIAVFGLFLFGGSVAGILTESGYTERPWPTLLGLGVVLTIAGAAVVLWQVPLGSISLDAFGTNGVLSRALAIAVAGVALAIAGAAASAVERSAL